VNHAKGSRRSGDRFKLEALATRLIYANNVFNAAPGSGCRIKCSPTSTM
jgi:hypothetical protein